MPEGRCLTDKWSVVVHLPPNVRPELLEFVGHRIPHHLRAPPCQRLSRRVVCGGVVQIRAGRGDRVPADSRQIELRLTGSAPRDEGAAGGVPRALPYASLM